MRFIVNLQETDDGDYLAACDDPQTAALGTSQANALDRLRQSLRYHLELCPCSGIDPDLIEFDVTS